MGKKECFTVTWKEYEDRQWHVRKSWHVAENSKSAILWMINCFLGVTYVKSHRCKDFSARCSTREEIDLALLGKTYFRK